MGSFLQAKKSAAEVSETPKKKQNIEYIAPAANVLESFAHQVCQSLGGEYAGREVERDFADFMILVSRILANNLNRDPGLLAELIPESSDCKPNGLE